MYLVKIARNGTVTIPARLRKKYGMNDGDMVGFEDEDGVRLVKAEVMGGKPRKNFDGLFEYSRKKLAKYSLEELIAACKEQRRKIYEEGMRA